MVWCSAVKSLIGQYFKTVVRYLTYDAKIKRKFYWHKEIVYGLHLALKAANLCDIYEQV